MKKQMTIEKREKRIRRRARRRLAFSILLLTAVILIGGSFLAVVLDLQRKGMFTDVFKFLGDILFTSGINSALIIFWALVIPALLIIFLVINFIRRRKFGYFRKTWEDTAQLALDMERRAAAEEEARRRKKDRFSQLSTLPTEKQPAPPATVATLAELCDRFRMYAATELHLYYTEAQIREFIAGLGVSHILILQGISGTGKTSLTYAFGEFLGNPATIVPVQPMWKERSDLLGYYNEFTRKYNETPLLRKMYEANASEEIYITVLDEMNIARVEYYFAEFLSLLEIPNPELRYLEVVSDKWDDDPAGLKDGRIKLPENMWFVGTANNDDSTFAISDKVYDRAMIIDLDHRTGAFSASEAQERVHISYAQFTALTENAKRGYELTRRNERRLQALDAYLMEKFQITFGNRILRQIRAYISVYVSCGGDELDALDDILSKKVLRKLTYKDLSLYAKELAAAEKFFEELFGEGKMPKCRALLSRINKL